MFIVGEDLIDRDLREGGVIDGLERVSRAEYPGLFVGYGQVRDRCARCVAVARGASPAVGSEAEAHAEDDRVDVDVDRRLKRGRAAPGRIV